MKKLVFIDLDGVIRKEVDLLYKKYHVNKIPHHPIKRLTGRVTSIGIQG